MSQHLPCVSHCSLPVVGAQTAEFSHYSFVWRQTLYNLVLYSHVDKDWLLLYKMSLQVTVV